MDKSHVITSVFSYFLHGDRQGWKQAHAEYIKKKIIFTVKNIFKICYHNIFSFVKSTF